MYKLVVKMAWASLFRRRSRSALVVVMIALCLWGLLVMQGMYEGMTEQMIENAIRSGSGHISLYARGYRLDADFSKLVEEELTDIEAVLSGAPQVASYVKRIRQEAVIATAQYARSAELYGIDLEAEKRHGRLDSYLRAGEYSFGLDERGALVGARIAEKLHLKIGAKVILSAQNLEGDVTSIALRVLGMVKTNNAAIDESAVFISSRRIREFLALDAGVSQICIIMNDERAAPALQERLQTRFAALEVFRWDELYPALMQSRVMMERFSYVTYLLVFCVAALGIFGVILVSVLERTREFGVMLAIGSDFALIRRMVLCESFFLGIMGYGLGILLGWSTLSYFHTHGLDLTAFSKGLDSFGMDAVMYAIVKPGYFITGFLAVFAATGLSVILPLRVLKKARPIEAISAL